jgi:phenylacetate-CoA ligase
VSLLDRIYARSPVFVQNAMATGYGIRQRMLRNRGEFPKFFRELDAQQWLSADELQELQNQALRRTIAFAATNVPYYRDMFATLKLAPRDIKTPADLHVLPFLDKGIVQREFARLRPDRVSVPALAQSTGGTTGRPVPYFTSPSCIQFNYATYEARFRRWAGVEFGDRMVTINGKPIVPMTQNGPPYWRRNLAFNQLYVSAYHLSDANLPAIIDRMAEFQPRVIVAYTSAAHRIARFMNDRGWTGRVRPRAVLVSSETVFDWQREDMERAFACKVFNGYSLGEPVCFVTECPEGSMHISPEYGVIELLESDEGHEVVATGLINEAMPFVRYRTGDLAVPGDGARCACGRGLPTIGAIHGRVDDMVVNPEGVTVGPAALSLAFQSVPNLREAQIVQDSPDRIELALAVASAYGPADEQFLLAELRKRLGLRLAIDISYVDAVPRTSGGKQRLVVSSLKRR